MVLLCFRSAMLKKDYGFIILTEHLVNQNIVDKSYEMFMDFYKLPVQDKLKYGKEEYKRQRGYIPFGLEKAVGEKTPDLKEFFLHKCGEHEK